MLKLDHIGCRIAQQTFTFHFSVPTGGRTAILGPSGCGKSTLLNLVAGFLSPEEGGVYWQQQRLNGLAPHLRPVTTLFQSENLFAHLDVLTNIALGIRNSGHLSLEERREVQVLLKQIGLPNSEGRLPSELSGGQQQRVALARSLLRAQPLLLLDEPFSALDTQTRDDMLQLTSDMLTRFDKTLLMVTHNALEAEALGAQVLHMTQGRLVVA